MKSRTTFEIAADEPALILYWPVANGGLWDPAISSLIERLEDELEVFVTCVGSGRGALGMTDATAAARFMGCSSLVVVSPEGMRPIGRDLESASADCGLPMVSVDAEWTATAVAEAYYQACRHVEQAA